ncbi:MAG: hypothetical protein AAF153_03320, partial [Pseudomonadota bacterium]
NSFKQIATNVVKVIAVGMAALYCFDAASEHIREADSQHIGVGVFCSLTTAFTYSILPTNQNMFKLATAMTLTAYVVNQLEESKFIRGLGDMVKTASTYAPQILEQVGNLLAQAKKHAIEGGKS